MNKEDLPIEKLNEEDQFDFVRWSVTGSIFATATFVVVLFLVWTIFGSPSSVYTAVHPREIGSIPAILLSNFFHRDTQHLTGNLIIFVPLGFFVFRLECLRGLVGIFIGMMVASTAEWLFAANSSVSYGFSGAVMACWGILFVSVIRRDYRLVVVFLFLSYAFMELTLFETIRPTAYTKENNIAWLGHLGGVIGGMASQIRSLPIALELLYKEGKVTKEEFITIANRINKDTSDEVATENFQKPVNDFPEEAKKTADAKTHSKHEKTDGKE